MKEIIDLVDLISRQKIHQIELIDELDNDKNLMSVLYRNIANGKVNNESQAYDLLYNGIEKRNNLNKIKNRLQKRLLNSIFFIDQNGNKYSKSLAAGRECYKNYSAIKLLIGYRKRESAITLAKKTLRISEINEFTDLNYLLSSLLTSHYSMFSIKPKLQTKYRNLKNYYLKALEAENDVEELYGELGSSLTRSSVGLSIEEVSFHRRKIEEISKSQEIITTMRFNLYANLYQANYFLETRDYVKIIALVDKALDFFRSKGIKSVDADFGLKTRGGIAFLMTKKYDLAENYFKENLKISSPKFVNWYTTYNFLFPLKILKEDYNGAYNVLSIVINNKEFDFAHGLYVQLFKIKEAYIHFLVQLGKIDASQSEEKPLRKFRLNRFLNDVPTYSKDKRGVNISILIIQMLLLVQNKKHGEIVDKLDALNMYSHRYLRSDNTFRSNCFIKMLAKLPDADYHPIRWERYVKKFRKRLEEHPFELSYHNLDLEVIPFETLYDLVVEMLYKQKGIKQDHGI